MNINDLYNKVEEEDYQVISFDLFDTLVKRPVVEPTDLFVIMGKRLHINQFKSMRIAAEQVARKRRSYMQDEVTMDEIYTAFVKLFRVDYSIQQLVDTELEVEFTYCMPRQSIVGVYNHARICGKKVVILTDTYLPRDFVERLLEKCEINGYDELYVSSNDNATKASGRLYRKLLADLDQEGIHKKRILHIGDNKKTDIKMAKEAGIAVQHVLCTKDVFTSRKRQKQILEKGEKYGDNNLMLGYIMSELYDDPYRIVDKQTLFNGELDLLGAMILGPFLLSAVKWLMEDSIVENIEELIWVYRDGYIPSILFEELKPFYLKAPKTKTMYLSRNMRYYFGSLENNGFWENLCDITVDPNMSLENFMENRLLITEDDEKEAALSIFKKCGYQSMDEPIKGREQYQEIIPELEVFYYKNATAQAEAIRKYYENIIDKSKKTAVFDVGYRASVPEHLKKYSEIETTAYQIMGRPISRAVGRKNHLTVKSYIEYGEAVIKDAMILNMLMEQAISVQDYGTAVKYDTKNDCLVMGNGNFDKSIESLQEGIIRFAKGFIHTFAQDISDLDLEGFQFFAVLYDFLKTPSRKDADAVGTIQFFESEFIRQSQGNYYQNWRRKRVEQLNLIEGERKGKKQPTILPGEQLTIQKSSIEEKKTKIDRLCIWLSKYHLFYFCRGIYRFGLKIAGKKNHDEIKMEQRFVELQNLFLQEISRVKQKYSRENERNYLIIGGDIAGFDKGSIKYHVDMMNYMENTEIFVISGVPRLSLDKTAGILPFPFAILPKVAVSNQFDESVDLLLPKEVENFFNEKEELGIVVQGIYDRYSNMGKNYPEALVYLTYQFINEIFQIFRPFAAILWNKYRTAYSVMNQVCKDMQVRSFFMEFGAIPGSFSIDVDGQMGESFPAVHSDEFRKLSISEEEWKENIKIMQFLKDSKLNRNIQPISNEANKLKEKIANGKLTVFYAGQNDYESGLFPYTETTKQFHSPNFKTSDEVCYVLADLANKNGWNLVYKPHPIMLKCGKCKKENLPQNVIYTSNIDINEVIDMCDVTITILSQTSYLSLIREKPVVMLGYTQLKGKGCTYEAFDRDHLERSIEEALQMGYTQEQKDNFYLHVAQMNKYYVYDDLNERELRYGQSVQQFVDYLLTNV